MRSLLVHFYSLCNPFYASVVRTFSISEWNQASGLSQHFPPLRTFNIDASKTELGLPEPVHLGVELPACPSDLSDFNVPRTCAVPKRKLSLHRRGNRRVWYQLKRKTEVAQCAHCSMVGPRGTVFTGGQLCTGECLKKSFTKTYPEEYKQPC
ncbi:hypothetical protein CEUSTIGMA_g11642.t1 [Chlamydomonas eustigma]|uniref:Uncharacterized protein n=1 Tax=Chlamydomonas eustigma TaxID=1157962 RepID=A0A250XMR4_9CHLO|nr:hypothetical protein CEUSTIGMA_g11642.t1 [Chlamydomonas eustigma]|eukprot:GAX84219.1 hypothetical protein CEUSTIGMA_g11642.t1 [Chlamydomonas eustigma]